jgi:hypothetical protein
MSTLTSCSPSPSPRSGDGMGWGVVGRGGMKWCGVGMCHSHLILTQGGGWEGWGGWGVMGWCHDSPCPSSNTAEDGSIMALKRCVQEFACQ